MNKEKPIINIKKLTDTFTNISQGIEKHQLDEFYKEIIKIYPSYDSEVLISTDYDEEENSVGFSIYVSKPKADIKQSEINFSNFMSECLLLSDVNKLANIWNCLELMEQKQGDKYDLDFIPVFYNNELGDYYIHGRIKKKK